MHRFLLGLLAVLLMVGRGTSADLPAADKLPAHKALPDPLVMFDGTPVRTADDWVKKRRPELKKLFQHYMYGDLPAPTKVAAKLQREDKKALGGKAILREISLTVAPEPAPKVHLLLVIPKERKTPSPVFVGMNFSGNHALLDDPDIHLPTAWMYPRAGVKDTKAANAGRGKAKDVWAIDQSIARGYAVATFYNGDIDPDRKEVRGGVRPFIDKEGKAGTIAAWAWGIHRVVDYLVTVPELDRKRIAVVGHSRLGKTALLAAAFDERIALAIPLQAGCGGTAPSRGTVGESVKRINTAFPHWFNAEFKKFNDHPERLPFDQNCLTALVAPRPVLFSNAVEDTWANPDGQFDVLVAAEPVYRLLKAGGLESKTRPKVGVLSAGVLGYYIRPGTHSMTREDWKVFLDFADKHLGKPTRTSALPRQVLLLAQGPDGHPFASHEYAKGLAILAACLKNVPDLKVTLIRVDGPWKEGPELIDRADGVVLFLSEGARWVSADPKRLQALQRLAKRKGGLVTLHWAMGTRAAEPITAFVDLFGGCHGGPDRKYKVVQSDVRFVGKHPITHGLVGLLVKDEFYYRLKLAREAEGLVPLLRVKIDGGEHTVGWAYDRPAGGRGFGFSGLHFHDNWKLPAYRRLVAQGVVWSLGLPIPEDGLKVDVPENLLRALPEKVQVIIRTEAGDIEVALDAKHAPITVDNFLRYVDAGLYNGGVFHRTVRGDNQPDNKVKIAVVQAGVNPKRAKEEFAPIALERTKKTGLKHVDGAISMARDGPDTATGDFFICIGDQPELNQGGKRQPDRQGFAAFGRVVKGMDVVKKINAASAKEQTLTPPIKILTITWKEAMH